jgi:hypothetical protein
MGAGAGDRKERDLGHAGWWRTSVFVVIGVGATGFLAASLFQAPLVSVFFVGLLLICPLMLWVPFRRDRPSRPRAARRSPM